MPPFKMMHVCTSKTLDKKKNIKRNSYLLTAANDNYLFGQLKWNAFEIIGIEFKQARHNDINFDDSADINFFIIFYGRNRTK